MKKIKIPILTDEYLVELYIGSIDELAQSGMRYLEKSEKEMKEILSGKKGITANCLIIGKHPIIMINDNYSKNDIIATVAHEAAHAVDCVIDFVSIDDNNQEFLAHGIGVIVRKFLELDY